MHYGEGLLEEILRRTDLVQLVGRRVRLQRRGRTFWGLCPFHKEKSPSFKVEHERRNFKCFGCNTGGNAFKWLMETEGLSFPEAVARLAGEAGVDLPKWTPQDESREEQKKSLYEIVETACGFFERQLREPVGAVARAYLASRGLVEDAWRQFRLGYAPPGRSALLTHLKSKGVSAEDAASAGLTRAADEEQPARDFFCKRVMFPIADAKSRIVAFGARAIEADAKPKYINTGETPLFSKGRLLYNFSSARTAALKTGSLVVVEGYMDVIALVRGGFEAAVAPLGTALTADQLALLWRVAAEPILSFDGDEAGLRAASRAAALALPLLIPGHSLRFAFLPAGEDPDSLIRAQGAGPLRTIVEHAIPLVDMIWRMEADGMEFDTPERKAALLARLNERLRAIPSTDVRRFYLDEIARNMCSRLGSRIYVYGEQLRASGALPKRAKTTQTYAEGRTTAVSSAVKSSRLVAREAGKRAVPAPDAAPSVRIGRAPPPVAPRQSAADGFGPSGPEQDWCSRRSKETEVLALLLASPEILERHHEIVAAMPLTDRSLDSLRHELLNLAASGFRLETGRLEDHLVRAGMGTLVERLNTRRAAGSLDLDAARKMPDRGDVGEIEFRWLMAAAQLREMAESEPERRHALERFKSEASEESWRDWHRLLLSRALPR